MARTFLKTLPSYCITALLSLVLSGCYRYDQPPTLTLSGEYRIDRITYEKVDNSESTDIMVFQPGDLYINPNDRFPLDTIQVGFTRWHIDYAAIRFEATNQPDGSLEWSEPVFYDIDGQFGPGDLGYFTFNIDGTRRVWKIVSDEMESITFRTSGLWANSSNGPNEQNTIYLTRVGP